MALINKKQNIASKMISGVGNVMNGIGSAFKSKPVSKGPQNSLNVIPKYFNQQKQQMDEVNRLTKGL